MTSEELLQYIKKKSKLAVATAETQEILRNILGPMSQTGDQTSKQANEILQDPNKLLEYYYQDILKAIYGIDQNCNMPNELVFWHAFTSEILPYYVFETSDKKIIVFDEFFEQFFFGFIVTSLVWAYTKPSQSRVEYYNKLIIESFNTYFAPGFSPEKHIDYATKMIPVFQTDIELTLLGHYITNSISVFSICHELAHFMLGHRSNRMLIRLNTKNDEISARANIWEYNDEYQADKKGYELYLSVIENTAKLDWLIIDNKLDRMPFVLFETLNLIHLYRAIELGKKVNYDSHPPPLKRKVALQTKFRAKLSVDGVEIYDGLMDVLNYIKGNLKKH